MNELNIGKKQRSPRYPIIDLEEAITIISNARKISKKASDATLAGNGSTISGSFRRKKATLRYFGLISGQEDNTIFTTLADQILFPKDGNERSNALKEAFLAPKMYKSIFDDVEKNVEISRESLGNKIVREFGISIKDKITFVRIMINSGKYAGLIETDETNPDGIKFVEIKLEQNGFVNEDREFADTTQNVVLVDNKSVADTRQQVIVSEEFDFKIPLSNGIARLILPKKFTPEDKYIISSIINALLKDMEGTPSGNGS